jgi:hypothetical protein
MGLSIVCGSSTIGEFTKSRYWRQSLGLIATVEKNGRRVMNDSDKFQHFYNTTYRTTIYGQGNVGDIRFYKDFYINDKTIAVYYGDNFEEFVYKFDYDLVSEKGVDFYLGHLLKKIEEEYEERAKQEQLKKLEPKPQGNAEVVVKNPGAVTYDDVKAYLEKKRIERTKNL